MEDKQKNKVKYDIGEMKKALKKCDNNIAIYEEAIQTEIKTKNWYRNIITELEMRNGGTE